MILSILTSKFEFFLHFPESKIETCKVKKKLGKQRKSQEGEKREP